PRLAVACTRPPALRRSARPASALTGTLAARGVSEAKAGPGSVRLPGAGGRAGRGASPGAVAWIWPLVAWGEPAPRSREARPLAVRGAPAGPAEPPGALAETGAMAEQGPPRLAVACMSPRVPWR